MRRILLSSVTITFALGFFLASCSGFKQMEIDKRHYRNGFYVHQSGKTHTAAVADITAPVVSENSTAPVATAASNETSANVFARAQDHNAEVAAPVHSSLVAANSASVNVPNEIKKNTTNDNLQLPLTIHRDHMPSQPGDDTILYIILAILLPWLAVLLYEGQADTKFWISLLLWFLFIIPGIIYAILVVTGSI